MKKIAVIGYGAFAREIICNVKYPFDIFFYGNYSNFDLENIEKTHNCKCYDLKLFDKDKYSALVTIPDGNERKNIVLDMPKNTSYYTYIDKNAILMDKNNKIGEGSIICAGTILTTNVVLGNFTQLNVLTTVGHDVIFGDFCTTGPSVNISGNCNIGNNVYFGSNCTIKQKINIADNVTIGLGSSVVKHIIEPGVYIGLPVKKLIK